MYTWMRKLEAARPVTSARFTRHRRGHGGSGAGERSLLSVPRGGSNEPAQGEAPEAEAGVAGTASPHAGHRFSRIPVHRAGQDAFRTAHVPGGVTGPIAAPPLVHEVLRSPGQPLDPATRAFVEPRFGHDFSDVSVHTGPKAAESAEALNAAAYTVGHHIVLGNSKPSGEGDGGHRTLAHELAHVVQQRRGGPSSPGAGSGALEEAADTAASALAAGEGPVPVSGASAPGLACQPTPGSPAFLSGEADHRVAVARIENEDGTWSAVNDQGVVLYTGLLGLAVDPALPNLYSTTVVGERDQAADERRAALRQWADPAWEDPLSPIRDPASYDPRFYDQDALARKAAERKFDEYDQQEYGAGGHLYKKRGSGRVYANDIKAEDYAELTARYGIKVSTDPYRVVLPVGSYEFETIYEGKLIRKIMEENQLPEEAIHQVAMQLDAEIVSEAFMGVASMGVAQVTGGAKPFPPARTYAPTPTRTPPGPFGRAYLKIRLWAGLAGQGVSHAGVNPTIGAGGSAGRPVATLQQPSVAAPRITAPVSTAPAPTTPVIAARPPIAATSIPTINSGPANLGVRPPVVIPVAPVVSTTAPMRRPPGGGDRAGMTATGGTLTPHKKSTPVVDVLPRSTAPMSDFEAPEPGHYIRRKPPNAETQRQILAKAGRTSDGRLRDANTGRALEDGEAVWGHSPFYQFAEMRDMAESLGWTQDDFDRFFEDPDKWQVEYGPSNSSRVFDRIPRQRPVH